MPIQTAQDYKRYLHADLRAYGVERWGLLEWLRNPVLRYQRLLRKTEYIANCKRGRLWRLYEMWLKWQLMRMGIWLGFTIPINVFGPGLSIAHWGTIIVSRHARIGANCRIHPGTCIGEMHGSAPALGDWVYIGPGAKLYGAITIGDGVTIGANSVVGRSFPDNVVIVGAPARIIRYADPMGQTAAEWRRNTLETASQA